MEITAYLFLLLIFYIYLGYPICIFFLSKFIQKKVIKGIYHPTISIIISAYNEENNIGSTINNKLEIEYPKDKIEIIVVSDCSSDNTDNIIQSYVNNNVRFYRQSPRQGKTAAVNMAVSKANGEIIVFSDANSIYDKNAILELVKYFIDPNVGYVTGKMLYVNNDGSVTGDGCSYYMRYENFIRKYESIVNSIVGVDGGIDAMRKNIYEYMNPDQLPDFVQPLFVIEKGYRVLYDENSMLKEESLDDFISEYRMRVRVSLRALWALYDMRRLFNPFKYPLFSWQLLSHKLLRYFAWLPLVLLLYLSIYLSDKTEFLILLIIQLLFYTIAAIGLLSLYKKYKPRFISVPFYFVLVNLAALQAFLKFIQGKKQNVWEPRTG